MPSPDAFDASLADTRCRTRWIALVAVWAACVSIPVAAKAQDPPQVVTHAEVEALAGEWFEVASTGTWWHRRCASDTRYRFDGPRSGRLQASTAGTAGNKVQHQRGTLRGSRTGDGRLSIRFTPRLFRWLSATWSDFWILSAGDRLGWLLVGDNSRERLFVISRT